MRVQKTTPDRLGTFSDGVIAVTITITAGYVSQLITTLVQLMRLKGPEGETQ
jgi:hypothetical protein